MSKPLCQSLRTWLKANLGNRCLAPLTSADSMALDAAVHVAALWAYTRRPELADAFAGVVELMQSTTRHLAYHAVAHYANWEDRATLWGLSGLPYPQGAYLCAFEPGGSQRTPK